MVKVADIKSAIVKDFGIFMSDLGFVFKKTDNQFIYNIGDYSYIFNMLITSWSDSSSISVRLFVVQKAIEQVYKEILGKSGEFTLYQNMLERIYYSPDGRVNGKGESLGIWIQRDEDMIKANTTLRKYYDEIAKPYFSKFTSLRAFDDYINNMPFDYSPAYVGGTTANRCIKGLIVARMVNNSNYQNLVDTYDEIIKETPKESMDNYLKVRDYLSYNPIL